MELVINIPEEVYDYWKEHKCEYVLAEAIANAKPLPRWHGRLIDADDICKCNCNDCHERDICDTYNAPTVIDASTVEEVPLTAANNMTNGDMLRAMFPDAEYTKDTLGDIWIGSDVQIGTITLRQEWWNAPYKDSFSTAVTT